MRASLILLLTALSAFASGEFVFEKNTIAVTAAPEETHVLVKFPFIVKGEQAAVVKNVEAPCSCLEAKIGEEDRKTWQPEEQSYVTGKFEIGTFRGTVKKSIHITMADGKKHSLTVAMTTPKLITIEPKTLKWKAGVEAVEKSIQITLTPKYPVNIESVTNSNPEQFVHHLETLNEGKDYLLRITPKSTTSRSLGIIRILTDSKNKRHKTYQAFVVVEQNDLIPQRPKK